MNRVEVLEKVKGLLLLPALEMATTQQVADFYEVDAEAVRQVMFRHRDEIDSDGFVTISGKDLKTALGSDKMSQTKITNKRGHFVVEYEGHTIKMSHAPNGLFPKRAILRVGMLLRDSEVAKEVRTQLLNITEKAPDEVKVADIVAVTVINSPRAKSLGSAYPPCKLIIPNTFL